ncbi:MAG TPA: serine/threonine-protein kinase, partial [Planctomycetota bacterium]|nr:serine/threonine-protein kinase [Planctomycetota bacterium]
MKAATEQSERNPLDLVAEEFADKCRRGLNPSIEEYVRNNPEMSAELRELLPTVVMMEQLKVRKKSEGIPERLGEYHILREIGRGGMGVVYEAEHKALGRRVALKVAPAHLLIDPMRLQRFQREAQAAARLHHTNIVPVFGMGESSGLHYIIMQYISGCSLNQLLAGLRKNSASGPASLSQVPPPRGPRYWNWVAQIGVQVADALGYAHDQATLHRDIKPGNILLDAHGTAWVADFGLAKISGRDDLTQTGDIIGTLQYMAPEALQGCGDTRSDLYSVALTLYELLTLQSPFPELGTLELVKTIGEKEPPRPRAINADIPVDLETIILKGSARNPADRYQTAAQFADDLRCFLEDRPIAARPVRMHERCWRWCRRNRALAGAGAIAVASFICALVAGWVGYVSTTAALERESQRRADAVAARKRAEQNVQMSLQAFEDIFHQLEPSDGFAPPRRPRMAPPDPNRGPRGNGENGPPPPDGPGGSPRRESEENLAVLQSVLKFYERFAAENETNINLQYEAAKAYGRVGEIQHRLGDLDKAAATLTRAVQMMTKLHSSYPENDTYTE